jgi:hypothetical protein
VARLKFQGKLFVELPEADASSKLLDEEKRREGIYDSYYNLCLFK